MGAPANPAARCDYFYDSVRQRLVTWGRSLRQFCWDMIVNCGADYCCAFRRFIETTAAVVRSKTVRLGQFTCEAVNWGSYTGQFVQDGASASHGERERERDTPPYSHRPPPPHPESCCIFYEQRDRPIALRTTKTIFCPPTHTHIHTLCCSVNMNSSIATGCLPYTSDNDNCQFRCNLLLQSNRGGVPRACQAFSKGLTRLDRAMVLPLDVRDDYVLPDATEQAEGMLDRSIDMVFNCAGVSTTAEGSAGSGSSSSLGEDVRVSEFSISFFWLEGCFFVVVFVK